MNRRLSRYSRINADTSASVAEGASGHLDEQMVNGVQFPSTSTPRRQPSHILDVVRPTDVVARWVELFNAADVEGLAALYAEDAVNHQVVAEPVVGREAIAEMFRREFSDAEMTCIPEVIHDAGETTILEWIDPAGLRGCGFFTIRDGRIVFQRGYWDKLSFLRLHNVEDL